MAQTDTQTPDNQLYLDDLVVGQRFTSRAHVVDATETKAFARQFDPQPFHLDEETAKRAFFRRTCREWLAHCGNHHVSSGRDWPAARGRHHWRRRRTELS